MNRRRLSYSRYSRDRLPAFPFASRNKFPRMSSAPQTTYVPMPGACFQFVIDIFGAAITRSLERRFSHITFKISGTETNGNLFVIQAPTTDAFWQLNYST